jgi:hypothetical protein
MPVMITRRPEAAGRERDDSRFLARGLDVRGIGDIVPEVGRVGKQPKKPKNETQNNCPTQTSGRLEWGDQY